MSQSNLIQVGDLVVWKGAKIGGKKPGVRKGIVAGTPELLNRDGVGMGRAAWPVLFDDGRLEYVFENQVSKL